MLKGWKTVIFNIATVFVSVAGIVLQYLDMLGLKDETAALIGMLVSVAVAVANNYLRSITTTPIGKSI